MTFKVISSAKITSKTLIDGANKEEAMQNFANGEGYAYEELDCYGEEILEMIKI